MADFLAYRIIDGKLTFARVPKALKEDVRRVLIDLGKESLIVE